MKLKLKTEVENQSNNTLTPYEEVCLVSKFPQFIHLRLPALYSTDDGSRQGYFFHVEGKKIRIKIPDQLMLEERKKIKGID